MKTTTRLLKLLVSKEGDVWTLTEGRRRLGAFTSMPDAMAAVKLFTLNFERAGFHCEFVVEEDGALGRLHPTAGAEKAQSNA